MRDGSTENGRSHRPTRAASELASNLASNLAGDSASRAGDRSSGRRLGGALGRLRRAVVARAAGVIGLLALLLLSGCSIRKIFYNYGSTLLMRRINDTFALRGAQKQTAETLVRGIHGWHRKSELPRYVQILDGLMARAQDGLTQEELTWVLGEVDGATKRVAERVAPDAARMLRTLTPDQIQHAEGAMHKGEQERFERLERPENEYVAFRLKRARKTLTDWLGSYTEGQLQEFERFIRKNRPEEQKRLKVVQENQRVLIDALRKNTDEAVLRELVYRWFSTRQVNPTPEYQKDEEQNWQEFTAMLVAVDRQMTPQQRQHLLDELRSLRKDLAELAAQN